MVAYILKLPCNKVSVLNEVLLNPLIANPQNGQTHSNNSLAKVGQLFEGF